MCISPRTSPVFSEWLLQSTLADEKQKEENWQCLFWWKKNWPFCFYLPGFCEGLTSYKRSPCSLLTMQAPSSMLGGTQTLSPDRISGLYCLFLFAFCFLQKHKSSLFLLLFCSQRKTDLTNKKFQRWNFWTLMPQVAEHSRVHPKTSWQQCLY